MIPRTIRCFIGLSVLSQLSISLIGATYVMFLRSHGLTSLECSLVNLCFFMTLFICEIPTGSFADAYGYKKSYVISCFLWACGCLIYSQSTTFSGFLLAEMIAGAGSTFANGAFDAWLVGQLKKHGSTVPLTTVFSRTQWWTTSFGIAGIVLGGYAASCDIRLPWLLCGLGLALNGCAAIVFLSSNDAKIAKKQSLRSHVLTIISTAQRGIACAREHSEIRKIIVLSMLQFFAVMGINMQWQPFFFSMTGNKSSLGFIGSGIQISLLAGIGLIWWHSSKAGSKKFNEIEILRTTQALTGIAILLTVLTHNFALSLGCFYIHEILRGMFRPLRDAALNTCIKTDERATILSLESAATHLAGGFGLIASGLIDTHFSTRVSWAFSTCCLVLGAWLLRTRRK